MKTNVRRHRKTTKILNISANESEMNTIVRKQGNDAYIIYVPKAMINVMGLKGKPRINVVIRKE